MEIIRITVGSLQTNCYILKTEKEALVIDPGGDADKILENIQNQKITIINTHYHFDHTLANNKIGGEVLIHEDDKKFSDFKIDRLLKEREFLSIGNTKLEVLHTPGHTPGSICLLSQDYVFTGDTLFENGYGRTDLPGGDQNEMICSLKKLYQRLKEGQQIYPGHGLPFQWSKGQKIC